MSEKGQVIIMYAQDSVNRLSEILYDRLVPSYNGKWKRFRSCQAFVSECINNRYFLLKSYKTVVGIVDDQEGELFELGKWSKTTSKQVTQMVSAANLGSDDVPFYEIKNRYLYNKHSNIEKR